MKNILRFSAISALCCSGLVMAAGTSVDISGDWVINSSVGGEIPITVNCTFKQEAQNLLGSCTPVMDNAEASEITGNIGGGTANWGYGVVFNGNPGTVDFSADEVSSTKLSGTLSLSGTTAPFEAERK